MTILITIYSVSKGTHIISDRRRKGSLAKPLRIGNEQQKEFYTVTYWTQIPLIFWAKILSS
jgi:hypothetical protein